MAKVSKNVFIGVQADEDEHCWTHEAGGHVDAGLAGRDAALTELRKRLEDSRALQRLTKTDLAARANLSRTIVSEAFQSAGPIPSARTVVGLARALRLRAEEVQELLELRRAAADETSATAAEHEGPGRLIGEWDPHDLEVHPAGAAAGASSGGSGQRALPGYVRRAHDRILAEAVQDAAEGRSRLVVLVGSSSVGKTRACWETVQPLAALGWRLWHPHDPTRAEAALVDLSHVQPRTVVWLNEAQHYLGHPVHGERVAAALHTLLTDGDRSPVLVLGTLWPEYAETFTALPHPGEDDAHSRVRELLSGHTLTVPGAFDQDALAAAAALAQGGDQLMADALTRAHSHGQITQDLAGAPELLRRYEHGSPPVRALLEAAMDARRLGVGLHLPQGFLIDAAADYLSDYDYDQLTENWAEDAFADLARPVHGRQAPLRRIRMRRPRNHPPGIAEQPPVPAAGPVFRLADFLEQHGRSIRRRYCPPASFWQAAHTHLTEFEDFVNLSRAAKDRHRRQWCRHLQRRAIAVRQTAVGETAPARAAGLESAEAQTEAASRELEGESWRHAEAVARYINVFTNLARLRESIGDREGADALYREVEGIRRWSEVWRDGAFWRPHDLGKFSVLMRLTQELVEARDWEGIKALTWQFAVTGRGGALVKLVLAREAAGDRKAAEVVAREASDAGYLRPIVDLVLAREAAGESEAAEDLAWATAYSSALVDLVLARETAGESEAAEDLAWRAADANHPDALTELVWKRKKTLGWESTEALALRAADAGYLGIIPWEGTWWPDGLAPDGSPTSPTS